jgi:hypothetical protein
VVKQRVERGADGAAGVEHVIAEHHVPAFNINADRSFSDHGTHIRGGKIVAVKLDVEHTRVDGMFLNPGDELAQSLGQWDPASLDPHQRQVSASVALLHNLVGQAHQRTLNL